MSSHPPEVSPLALRLFTAYSRRYVRRHFTSLRVLQSGLPMLESTRPAVVFLNHAAWWDPLTSLLLSQTFFPERTAFAPIDAGMLERYGFFRKLGFFAVQERGARAFLREAKQLLERPRNSLWMTPQGRFADPRERPSKLMSGLAALAGQHPEAAFLPLAIEYPFWTEPRPEILASFGAPIIPGRETVRGLRAWSARFAEVLEAEQDKLAQASCRRAPDEWVVCNRGAARVSVIYDAWRRMRAWSRGEHFSPAHSAR